MQGPSGPGESCYGLLCRIPWSVLERPVSRFQLLGLQFHYNSIKPTWKFHQHFINISSDSENRTNISSEFHWNPIKFPLSLHEIPIRISSKSHQNFTEFPFLYAFCIHSVSILSSNCFHFPGIVFILVGLSPSCLHLVSILSSFCLQIAFGSPGSSSS